MKKKINIAIVGLGNIGLSLYKNLNINQNSIEKKTNVKIDIKYVSAKNRLKKRPINIPKKKWLKNYKEAYKKSDIDIVVELIGGSEGAAKNLIFNSIKNKKHVVTANKALMSAHGDTLSKMAEANRVNLEFEAAVAGGVPIIRSLKEGLITNKLNKIYGILNGTSNFILSKMSETSKSFNEVLQEAQKLGYAESNPSDDINGYDAKSKIQILSALAFNIFINKSKINVEGIKNVDDVDIKNAKNLGYKIKHLAIAELKSGKLIQRVHPCMVKKDTYISNINGVLNTVIVEGKPIGKFAIQGEGAGSGPTTSALVSDICSVLRGNIKFPFSISNKERKVLRYKGISERFFSAYLRFEVLDKSGVLSNITNIFSKNNVSIKRVVQTPNKRKNSSSIIIITHKSKDFSLNKILKIIGKKPYNKKKPKLIRIDNN